MDVGLRLLHPFATASNVGWPPLLPQILGFSRVVFSISVLGESFERIVTPEPWGLFGEKAECWIDDAFCSDIDDLASSEAMPVSDGLVHIK